MFQEQTEQFAYFFCLMADRTIENKVEFLISYSSIERTIPMMSSGYRRNKD